MAGTARAAGEVTAETRGHSPDRRRPLERVVGPRVAFSIVCRFRPCREPAIGIERPQFETYNEDKDDPALTSEPLVPTERKPNVDERWFRDGEGRAILGP